MSFAVENWFGYLPSALRFQVDVLSGFPLCLIFLPIGILGCFQNAFLLQIISISQVLALVSSCKSSASGPKCEFTHVGFTGVPLCSLCCINLYVWHSLFPALFQVYPSGALQKCMCLFAFLLFFSRTPELCSAYFRHPELLGLLFISVS